MKFQRKVKTVIDLFMALLLFLLMAFQVTGQKFHEWFGTGMLVLYLFCSHGTGGLAGRVKDISAAMPDAEISDSVFDVYEEDAASAEDEIVEWIGEVSKLERN